MQHESWFVLPATMEHYYRRYHVGYRTLPPIRAGCASAAADAGAAMEFVYPSPAGKIYVPVELDGSKGRAVFEVVHRDAGAQLYWHLDGAFAGSTAAVHQLAVELPPGAHRVTVVDEAGNRLVRSFEILSRAAGDAAAP
jgi:penicillin-binding protein 1C